MYRIVTLAALLLVLALPLAAKKGGNKQGGGGKSNVAVVFAAGDLHLIHDYYGRQGLPPGIQKQLIRKGTLPPGIAKKIAPLPPELDRRLAPLPPGVHRGVYGGSAILYDPVARVIYDVADIVATVRGR